MMQRLPLTAAAVVFAATAAVAVVFFFFIFDQSPSSSASASASPSPSGSPPRTPPSLQRHHHRHFRHHHHRNRHIPGRRGSSVHKGIRPEDRRHEGAPSSYVSKYTVKQLTSSTFPNKISDDLYLEPCKAGEFMGDVAVPNVQYEMELENGKINKTYLEEVEKYKKELSEGLQIEEEGLLNVKKGVMRDVLKITDHTTLPTKIKRLFSPQHGSNNRNNDDESRTNIGGESKNATQYRDYPIVQEHTMEEYENYTNFMKQQKHRADFEMRKHAPTEMNVHANDTAFNNNAKRQGANGEESGLQVSNNQEDKSFKSCKNEKSCKHHRHHGGKKRRKNKKIFNKDVISDEGSNHSDTKRNFQDASEEHGILVIKEDLPRDPYTDDVVEMDGEEKWNGNGNGASVRRRRAATARKERIWDFGVIPYEIDQHFSGAHKALFKQAMRHWENYTCVKFIERIVSDHPNYIVFTERPCGCCSFVGKRGNGPQAISIGKNCDKFGIVVHELGHVVGFWHEHTRPDRDNHVQIVREHIMQGQEYNFNKLTEDEVNSLGLPYDYESIMHYARNTFSKGTYLDTIHPIESLKNTKKKPEIGQRIRLSEGDIAQTKLLYKCPRCGKTMQESIGNISYYQNHPNSSMRCEWRITATHGERIVLNITDLDIFKSDQCSSDYLEIRDGYWHRSKLIGRYCGNGRIQEPIISFGSRMLITHVTSEKGNKLRGFSANYEAVCGGDIIFNESGRLESPNYPDDYQPNKECIWRLTAPPRFQVALKFHSFEIENHDNCAYDYVEIRNGHHVDSPLIGSYCGYKLPPDIQSSANKLLLKFVSDGTVQKGGFSATFVKEFDECAVSNNGCEQLCINTLGSFECACRLGYQLHSDNQHCEDTCGGKIETSNGTITSPSFPDTYPGNKTCIWEIIAPPQYRITLNFTHFDLEGSNAECDYDRVEVHSKIIPDTLHRHGVFCGAKIPPVITSDKNILRIEFESDNSIHKSGFAAVFFTDMDECAINNGGCHHECHNTIGSYECSCHNGFTLHENKHDCKEGGCKHEIVSPRGVITTPNYPDIYPSKKDCIWHFITTPGHRIKLSFESFELEPHQDCSYDHIVLYDGDSTDSLMLGRYCGSKPPSTLISSANQLFMVFKSDSSVQRKGFHATHSTVCGGRLHATAHRVKHFYSHANYGDNNYDNDVHCEWTIEADENYNVRLTFLTFEVEDEKDCNYDYLQAFNGLDSSGQSYGKFCGNTLPADIMSANEALLVIFRSDSTVTSKGFSISYMAVESSDIYEQTNGKSSSYYD